MNKLNDLQNALNNATTKMELYKIAGTLNNLPEHILTDKVTMLGFMDFDYAKVQVQSMLNQSINSHK